MRIQTALLCDAANVREGLLNILSGLVTRVYRDKLPAPLSVSLALVFELEQGEVELPHEVTVQVNDPRTTAIARIVAGFQAKRANLGYEPGEKAMLPFVVSLNQVGTRHYGLHRIRVRVDESDPTILSLWVQHSDERQLPSIH